jgi:hypothetical protein
MYYLVGSRTASMALRVARAVARNVAVSATVVASLCALVRCRAKRTSFAFAKPFALVVCQRKTTEKHKFEIQMPLIMRHTP